MLVPPWIKAAGTPALAENLRRPAHRVAFPEGAQVEHHSGPFKADLASFRIQRHPLHARLLQGRLQGGGTGGRALLLAFRPQQRISGPTVGVKRPARLFPKPPRPFQSAKTSG